MPINEGTPTEDAQIINEKAAIEKVSTIEESVIEETPVIEEQPIIGLDNSSEPDTEH